MHHFINNLEHRIEQPDWSVGGKQTMRPRDIIDLGFRDTKILGCSDPSAVRVLLRA